MFKRSNANEIRKINIKYTEDVRNKRTQKRYKNTLK